MSSRLVLLLLSAVGCAAPVARTDTSHPPVQRAWTVLDLGDVTARPAGYDWFEFRPNVKKLILAGAPETEHVAILWYTTAAGTVGLHLHAKTESVYVIDGAQADGKGVYPKGTVYFNPPGSGHAIQDSSGFFLLAYAAPPDFQNTAAIREYTPVRIDTADAGLMSAATPAPSGAGTRLLPVPLHAGGGMSGSLIEITAPADRYEYSGNYVLALRGRCEVSGTALAERGLVVTKAVKPEVLELAAAEGSSCTALGVSF